MSCTTIVIMWTNEFLCNVCVCVYVYAFVNISVEITFFFSFNQQTINNVVTFQFGWIFHSRFIAFLSLNFCIHLLFFVHSSLILSLISSHNVKATQSPSSFIHFLSIYLSVQYNEISHFPNCKPSTQWKALTIILAIIHSCMKLFRQKYWTTTTTGKQVFL